jgi:hypothetical protein
MRQPHAPLVTRTPRILAQKKPPRGPQKRDP